MLEDPNVVYNEVVALRRRTAKLENEVDTLNGSLAKAWNCILETTKALESATQLLQAQNDTMDKIIEDSATKEDLQKIALLSSTQGY